MKRFSYIMIFILLTGCESCDDIINPKTELKKLPPATQIGENTFGCLINGNVWTHLSNSSQGGVFMDLQNSTNTVGVNIYADNYKENNGITISIFDDPTLKINKQYDLKDIKFLTQYSWHNDLKICTYDSILTGSITLSRFDISYRIISGVFDFKAYSEDCEDSIVLTSGRFDLMI